MSVLIKGMEMPERIEPGLVIEFADGIDGKRYARLHHYQYGGMTDWLEAVPVPPHGRLIDADAFCTDHRSMKMLRKVGLRRFNWYIAAAAFVDDAPTVIPAEEYET